MKILIMSDSHGLIDEVEEIKLRHQQEVDYMIHCGDSELKAADQILSGMDVVKGNCDDDEELPNEVIKEIDGCRFYITHGHLHNVKSTLMNVTYRALECNGDIVCFGHSHIAGAEMANDILFINPGSIRMPRMRKEKTYVILELENSTATVHFYEVNGDIIKGLTAEFILKGG
ncbi:metallophosphoesterase family protein [Metabacillus fastidiosus]|uniref:metallophosphoesterase family protein n=1 Tax=Metabacillus fastidiosus TaxID=1458 RepID=UPI003D2A5D93